MRIATQYKLGAAFVGACLLLAGCGTAATAPDKADHASAPSKPAVSAKEGAASGSVIPAPLVIPAPAWVADSANILSPETEATLTADLEALETRTHHQLVVVTLPGLGGKDVGDVGDHIGNCWGVGRKDHDDGVVLLVAPTERKVRISSGYGIEAYMPDARAKAIIDDILLPSFRKEEYEAGVKAGVAALIAELDKVPADTRAVAAEARKRRDAAKPAASNDNSLTCPGVDKTG